MDPNEFLNPDKAYRGITLWMLNDELEVDEIVRQLEGFAAAGWGAVIGRTFNGLRTEYLGDEWMAMVEQIIARARELGMRVWLQAGYMPSGVPDLDPACAHRALAMRSKSEPAEPNETVLWEDDEHVYCERVLGTVLDLLNGDAVADYLDLAYRDPWHSRFAAHFGETVEAIWVDEPHFRPPLLPWSVRLPRVFAEQWDDDITQHLPSLFRPVGEYHKIRHHYWRTVLGMFLEAYFQRVGQWCAAHDIKFSGHLMGEDTLNNQIAWTGAAMPCYEAMQLPGIDHLTMSLTWPTHKKFLLTPKQVTSAASQLGKSEALAEMYAVSSQAITFEDRKQIANWMAVLGINYRCYHGSFYSMRGRRKRIYAPHLSHQQPWWPDNRLIADYFARLSYALRRGQTRADVLVLHPVESCFCLYDPTTMAQPHDRMGEAEDVNALDTRLVDLCDNLLQIQRGFELGDETLMAEYGDAGGEGLKVGWMTYRAVILPEMLTIRCTTLALLEQFAAAGGTILSGGELPSRLDGLEVPGLQDRLAEFVRPVGNDPAALKRALNAAVPPDVEITATEGDGADVWVHARQIEEGRLYFLTNTNREAGVEGEVRLRASGALEEWDLWTGEVTPAPNAPQDDGVVVPVSLPPLGSRLLLLREDAEPEAVAAKRWTVGKAVSLSGRGRIRRDSPNALSLDICRLKKGNGDWSEPLPVIAVQERLEGEGYHGPVTLQFRFDVETIPTSLQVVIEDAEQYEIRVNGRPAREAGLAFYVDRAFHPVEATELVLEGENTVEISIDFRPLGKASFGLARLFEKREGVELESIYVIGDFAVRGELSDAEERPGCLRCRPEFVICEESETSTGNLSAEGYPFYAGRITYAETATLDRPADGERVVLELPGLDAVLAKVRVNGESAGEILWPPYEVDITEHVTDGDDEIEVELVSSLRNLLGPHHRSTGEPTHTWGTAFDFPPDRGRPEHPEELEAAWTDDYFLVHFGLRGPLKVKYLGS
ncbi:MAG: glycosyl hydrolase [Armatimonadota bacterium]|jgi:hypothetical protein